MPVSPFFFGLDDFAFPVVAGGITPDPADPRIVQLCDAVVAAIVAALPVGDTTVVSRVYLPEIEAETITGKKVFVFPMAYEQADTVTRGEDLNEYRVGVLTVERYETQGDVADTGAPRDWLDVRVKWVEQYVFDLLGTARINDMRAEIVIEGVWPETAGVESVYDPELLRDHKLFWSEFAVAFRRDE